MAQRYDTYKDSGVQWLGEIPRHWNCTSLGRVLSEKLQYGASESGDLECTNNSMRYIRITDITLDGKLKPDGCKYLSSEVGRNYPVKKGDVLLARSGATVGKAFIYNEDNDACYAGYLIKASVQQEKVSPQFFFYFTQTSQYDEWKNRIFIQATIQNISAEKYARMSLCIPPLSEQHSIVSYLDDKCGKIDKMLEGKQKQIELLAEMKQRIIADAVTRGLNPDVKMKATNIPWLPEIPEHWEAQRMATLFTGDIEINKDFEYKRAFKFNYGQLVPKNEIGEPEDYREVYVKYSKIKQGDILVNGLNLNYDFISQRVACAPSDGIITSAYVVCRPRKDVNYEYYTYLFKGMDSMKLFHGMGTGIRLTLSFKEMKKQILPIPPHSEQHDIVSYIKERSAKIDILTSKLQQEIESIKEYKQRLISDVVTGQIKVC